MQQRKGSDGGGRNDIEAAILDVNLGGELVYPVADHLRARGIPFIFVTGYARESVERRFADAPILEKPVEREMLAQIFGRNDMLERRARTA